MPATVLYKLQPLPLKPTSSFFKFQTCLSYYFRIFKTV